MFKFRITVFTPPYNRANTLERLYRSLQEQTFTDFEWLVVDDGSSDETNEMFKKWILEKNHFPISNLVKENGEKHTAINYGLDKAQGELFFTADSDDFLTEDSLKSFTLRNGALDYCQGDTVDVGIFSQYLDIMPFPQGMLFRAIQIYKNGNQMHN